MHSHVRVSSHGERELELNVTYPVLPNTKEALYELDWYIFTPPQLEINETRYGVASFYKNLVHNVRYAPFSLSLESLADPDCDLSPLKRVRDMLSQATSVSAVDEAGLIYELRVLSNIFHGQLRAIRNRFKSEMAEHIDTKTPCHALEKLLGDAEKVLSELRALLPSFLEPQITDVLRQAVSWTDESVSRKIEKELFRILPMIPNTSCCAELKQRVLTRIKHEQDHREEHGYPTQMDPTDSQSTEYFIYRENMLKKWTHSAMYMRTEPRRLLARISHFISGFAAAAAMAFAVLATILTQQFYAQFTLPWAIFVVVAYIFKDRLKEMLRQGLIAYLPQLVADEMLYLVDPSEDKRVGAFRSRIRFCTPAELPEEVQRLRGVQRNPFRNILPPESVLHYHRKLRLQCTKLLKGHQRLEEVDEITRLNLESWFDKMDRPTNYINYLNDGVVETCIGNRVYHVNMVAVLTQRRPGSEKEISCHRAVLCRDGILRIE